MGSTNFTLNYELSQFIGTDKPAWLQDYNGDMLKIDTGIAAAKTAADNAQSSADGAQGDATSALSDIANINTELGTIESSLSAATGNINTINSLIGDGTSLLTGQTIIAGLNSTDESIAPVENSALIGASYTIGDKFIRGGVLYEALTTIPVGTAFSALSVGTDYKIADDLTSQIQSLTNKIEGKKLLTTVGVVQVNGDGVKTIEDLLKELTTSVIAFIASIEDNEVVEFTNFGSNVLGSMAVDHVIEFTNNSSYTFIDFGTNRAISNKMRIEGVVVSSTPEASWVEIDNNNVVNYIDKLSVVPSATQYVRLAYKKYITT